MSQYSRREFLAQSAVGALALSSQGILTNTLFAADAPADMAVAKWTGSKDLTPAQIKEAAVKLTEKAIQGVGGLKRFLGSNAVVWIKPNIAFDSTPEQASDTNPDVVATIARLCMEAGAKKVKIGDNVLAAAGKTYVNSGISDAVKPYGAEMVFLDRSRFKDTDIKGERVKTIPIYPEIMECDLVINVPVIKAHRATELTMCMKNYMGVIERRQTFHQDLPTCLADLTRFMKPKITVLDAVRVLKGSGPTPGSLANVELKLSVAAGVDPVALDAWGAELMGKKPTDLKTITKGAEYGLGKIDYKSFAKEFSVA